MPAHKTISHQDIIESVNNDDLAPHVRDLYRMVFSLQKEFRRAGEVFDDWMKHWDTQLDAVERFHIEHDQALTKLYRHAGFPVPEMPENDGNVKVMVSLPRPCWEWWETTFAGNAVEEITGHLIDTWKHGAESEAQP